MEGDQEVCGFDTTLQDISIHALLMAVSYTHLYWYYNLGEAKASIPLTDFTAMGGDKTENFSFDVDNGTAKTFTYQFIVDFSQTTENRITDSLGLSLKLTASTEHNAPTIPISGETHISLSLIHI